MKLNNTTGMCIFKIKVLLRMLNVLKMSKEKKKDFKYLTRLLYIRTQCEPPSKQSPPRLYKTNLLMLCNSKVAVCLEICTKHINAM